MIEKAIRSLLVLTVAAVAMLQAQSNLPSPAKADVPYLIHATSLIETEQSEASEEERKDEFLYVIAGAASGVKTPLAGPEFLLRTENLDPNDMQLYRLESKNGRRELLFRKKKKILADPLHVSVFPVSEGLVKIRVDQSLAPGEYSLTPTGANTVFCFTVY
jgi:hypothetical protein